MTLKERLAQCREYSDEIQGLITKFDDASPGGACPVAAAMRAEEICHKASEDLYRALERLRDARFLLDVW